MPLLVLVLLIGLPIIELYVLIEVGGWIGTVATIALVIATAGGGLFLVRLQGFAALARAQASLDDKRFPVAEAIDGLFLLFAGGLLVFPGLITDALGLLLLIPPLRRFIGLVLWRSLMARGSVRAWTERQDFGHQEAIEGEFENLTAEDETDKPDGDKGNNIGSR